MIRRYFAMAFLSISLFAQGPPGGPPRLTHLPAEAGPGVRIKTIRKLERERFGIALTTALRRYPEGAAMFSNDGLTFVPRPGYSIWTVDGGRTVFLRDDSGVVDTLKREIHLKPVSTVSAEMSAIVVACPGTVAMMDPGGATTIYGPGCGSKAGDRK